MTDDWKAFVRAVRALAESARITVAGACSQKTRADPGGRSLLLLRVRDLVADPDRESMWLPRRQGFAKVTTMNLA